MRQEMLQIKGEIIKKYGSQGEFARHLGKTEQTITAKLNGRSKFSQDDIVEWCNALDIDAASVGEYFFAHRLSNS